MIESLSSYPEYKASGVPWVGEIPTHWTTARGKWLFTKVDRPARESDEVVTCFRDGTVTLRRNRRLRGFTESLKEIGYQAIRRGDLVIHAMDAFAGAIGVSDSDGKATPVYSVCEAKPKVNPYYYAYLLREMARSQWIQALATGIRERSTDFRFEAFGSQILPLPPEDDQRAIVEFLGRAERRIGRYIRTKERQVALLQEQKRAIVYRAVTRGIDLNARLRPSGVEWLGDVPGHWRIGRVKTELQNLNTLRVPLSATERGAMTAKRYDYYGASGIIDRVDDYLFDDELLLVAEDGANLMLRNLPLAIIARGKFWVNNHAHILKPRRGVLEFFAHLLECIDYTPWITGAAQPKLTQDRLMAVRIPIPPEAEQLAIVAWVVDHTKEIDQVIVASRKEIGLMRELRGRLVSDVVTGRLDVRAAAACLPGDATDAWTPPDEEGVLLEEEDTAESDLDIVLTAADA